MYTLPSLSPSILYRLILPLLRLGKNSASARRTSWHPGYDEKNSIYGNLSTWPAYVSHRFVLEGGQMSKNWTSNAGENWGCCCKKW